MAAAIIVGGGAGVRMGGEVRKQYLKLSGTPILCHTASAFDRCPDITRLILVLPPGDREFCRKEILDRLTLQTPLTLAEGGNRRQDSVFSGLQYVPPEEPITVIHDGVRPFVRSLEISAVIEAAYRFGAAIAAVPAHDTLKKTEKKSGGDRMIQSTLDREGVWMAQTPQAFETERIREAHRRAREDGFTGTDDASLIERMGGDVRILPGSRMNIKITTPEDLLLARAVEPLFPREDGGQPPHCP